MKDQQDYILHLASWYPSSDNPQNAIFIKNQVSLISNHIINGVLFTVNENEKNKRISINVIEYESYSEYIVNIPAKKWCLRLFYFAIAYIKIIKLLKHYGKPKLAHVHVLFPIGLLAFVLNIFYGLPYIVTEHFNVYCDKSTQRNKPFILRYSRFFSSNATTIHVVSNYLKSQLIKHRFNKDIIKVLSNYIDEKIFYRRAKNNYNGLIRFLHVSNLDSRIKNVEGILEAITLIRNENMKFQFTIVGSNNQNLELIKEQAKLLKIKDEIKYYGVLSQREIAELMRDHDVFVLNSNFETFSCVIAEAQCCGLACITTDIGGPKEIIKEDFQGIKIEVNNSDSLAQAMKYYIKNGTDSKNSKKRSMVAILSFGKKSFIKGIEDLYSPFTN